MINGLQILVYLPLFQITFPELSANMVISLITIVTFEVVPAEKILEALFQIPHDEQQNQKFVDVGFEGNYMILNLGTMFIIFMLTLVMPVLLFCSKPRINGRASLRKKHAKC